VSNESKEYRVIIPEEAYTIVEFKQEEMPGVMVINSALTHFEPKVVFSWHLSVMLNFEDVADNGMPSKSEQEVIEKFEDQLDSEFKGINSKKPNALFLARITWNSTKELIYRMYEPEPAHKHLQSLIEKKAWARTFDYRIDPDPDWKLAQWHLNTLRSKN
jgi:hypothetical protein